MSLKVRVLQQQYLQVQLHGTRSPGSPVPEEAPLSTTPCNFDLNRSQCSCTQSICTSARHLARHNQVQQSGVRDGRTEGGDADENAAELSPLNEDPRRRAFARQINNQAGEQQAREQNKQRRVTKRGKGAGVCPVT